EGRKARTDLRRSGRRAGRPERICAGQVGGPEGPSGFAQVGLEGRKARADLRRSGWRAERPERICAGQVGGPEGPNAVAAYKTPRCAPISRADKLPDAEAHESGQPVQSPGSRSLAPRSLFDTGASQSRHHDNVRAAT